MFLEITVQIPSSKEPAFTLTDDKDWGIFLIYVFTKDVIDLADKLTVLLREYQQPEVYDNFSVYIDQTESDRCFVFCSKKKTKN